MSANKPKTKAVKEWNFMDQELDDRKKKILKAIIKTYMETGEPVGSRTISKFADLNVSSATIRNEMSDLTDMGYIVQPHTSAGRIPSDKGYRLYVDELMREKESEVQEIKDLMIEKTDKLDKKNHPEVNRFDFTDGDKLADWAEKNGKALIGHCLVWLFSAT